MTACREIAALLPEFVAGDLVETSTMAVRQHLTHCVACRGDAGSLQRARAALQTAAARAVEGVDEHAFTAMHRSIVATATAAMRAGETVAAGRGRRSWWMAAAAVLLTGGLWLGVQSHRNSSVWRRPPTATPAASSIVVPWSGPRVDLRLLGDERPGELGEGWGTGLMGRHRLRSLVDDGIVLPPPQSRR